MSCSSHGNRPASSAPRLENPYDTMFVGNSPPTTSQRHHRSSQPPLFSEPGVYSDPGEVTGEQPSKSILATNTIRFPRQSCYEFFCQGKNFDKFPTSCFRSSELICSCMLISTYL